MSFFDKLFSIFSAGNDSESVKKKLLKQVIKSLGQNKFARFYRIKSEEATPALGKFFFDVYKLISPAQVFLQNAAKSAQLKQIVIDSFLDKKLLDIQGRLTPEAIAERGKTIPIKQLAGQVREELSTLIASFDTARVNAADGCYNTILGFIQFVTFDFFFLLKKFDANMAERNFSRPPKLENIRAEYIAEDIKDFLETAAAVDPDQDWKTVLGVLKSYKGDMDVISLEQWSKLLAYLRDIRRSGILELIIRHVEKNPVWQPMSRIPSERVVDAYLDAKKAGAEDAIRKIQNDKRTAQLDQLAKTVFGSTEITRLKYYTDKNNEIFIKKNLGGFTHVVGLNYLKAFLLDHVKKDIREICDLLLIRGQWTSNVLSQQLSEGFHGIMAISEQILTFDEALADNGENGSRLKACLVKVDRDKGQVKYIKIILKSVNEAAQKMIVEAAQALIVIGKNFKTAMEDYPKNPHELIINWKELESSSEVPIIQRITDVYKRMYYFVQIMQFFAHSPDEEGTEGEV
ncbi:MAG: DUF5312 family protein [Spirochaetaceae bacterium]|jgi:hypothetical protein|nr:DUF5312 family protein [Spirochaetaceae bacterium]